MAFTRPKRSTSKHQKKHGLKSSVWRQKIIKRIRGKKLDTPIYQIRVFHISNPDYTYAFTRKEGKEVIVVDDENGKPNGKRQLKSFPVDELVNVAVFGEELLRSEKKLLPRKPR